MIAAICDRMTTANRFQCTIILFSFIIILIFPTSNSLSKEDKSSDARVIYRNPQVINVDYTFELHPDSNKIDKSKDLKLWIPVPREWDSQKSVKILSIDPEPHARYEDPEHGNKILFWDFGKGPLKKSYHINIKYRFEIFEVHCKIDPEQIEPYDKNSKEYRLYTRSTYKINITPKIRELAQTAIGTEKNAYFKAKRIFEFVRNKVRYKNVRRERGSGVDCLLDFPVTDQETGEQNYEGACDQKSVFFVALCRAAGIPARAVTGMVGWSPWIKKKDLKLRSERHTKLSPGGLAAARLYGPMSGHIWTEFYLPGYGWIPVDPTWARFGHQSNHKLILSKGRDVKIGPHAPQEESEGYGDQWIPIHQGRADAIGWGVWNIAKIGVAKAKILQNSDPFPADGYVQYADKLYPELKAEENLSKWRKKVLLSFYNAERGSSIKGNIFETHPRFNLNREAYLCHLLHQIVGDEEFLKIFQTYLDLRLTSAKPVSVEKFKEIAERIHENSLDFYFKQWVNSTALPQFRLDRVNLIKSENEWIVNGSILQTGETCIRIPIELGFETEKGMKYQEVRLESNKTDFEYYMTDQPKKLIVDPDYHIPMIRWMPARIRTFWDFHPDGVIIYGTSSEAAANRNAAKVFGDKWLGLGQESIKADTSVTKDDLNKHFVILIGRPTTNTITSRLKNAFPVLFNRDQFLCQGITYKKPSQGIVLITESSINRNGWIILHAGLSREATLQMCKLSPFKPAASYIIFEENNVLSSGDWEASNDELVWKLEDGRVDQ